MGFRHIIIPIFILCIYPLLSRSQGIASESEPGLYFTRNFSPEEYDAHAQNWAVIQDQRGIIYIGNGEGILEYDGATWRLIRMPNKSVVRSIDIDAEGRIYVGAHAELGYLSPDSTGVMHYISLLDQIDPEDSDINNVWKVHATPLGTFFRTETSLFLWADNQMKVWKPRDEFHKSFYIDGVFYIREWASGLLRLDGDSLVVVPGGEKFIDTRIDVMLPSGDGRLLIGSRTSGLFTYDGNSTSVFATEADPYLKENQIYDGVRLPSGQIALATLRGGVVVIDGMGHFLRVINAESGLRDNTVWSLALDKQGALWLALNEGLARVELQSPMSFFSDELGLESSVESIIRYQGILYAASGLGLFYLDPSGSVGIPSRFKPVPGIEGQAWSLVTADNSLLAGTSQGIYLIHDDLQYRLNDNVTFFLYRSVHDPGRIFAGLGDGLALLESDGDKWVYRGRLPNITEEIRSITEDKTGDLWLGTAFHGALRIRFENRRAGLLEEVQVDRFGESEGLPLGEVVVTSINNEIMFGTEKGVRYYNAQRNRFMPVLKYGIEPEDSTRAVVRIANDRHGGFWMSEIAEHPEMIYINDHGNGLPERSKTPLHRISSLGPVWSIYPDEADTALVWFGTNS
ncbi:MAG: ligand-binding sensor domain-containing protein, partial [Bacteroidales bacterium]